MKILEKIQLKILPILLITKKFPKIIMTDMNQQQQQLNNGPLAWDR